MPSTNLLPGVPAIESPFFEAIFADADDALQQIARQMQARGFAVIEFPDPDFAAVADGIRQNLTPHFNSGAWHSFRQGAPADLRIRDAWRIDAGVRRIAANPGILALLSKLYGKPAWPFQTLNFPVGTEQALHSDVVHFHSVPERFMCGVWVALEDITLDNGPLFYYPGSHAWPVYTNEHIGRCLSTLPQRPDQRPFEAMWQALVDAHGVQPQQFLAKKGQALIWAANLLHGGSPHLNRALSRWSQVTHYFFEDCVWYSPLFSDPFYGQIYFRRLLNIANGELMQPQYCGEALPPGFIEATRSTQPDGPWPFDEAAYLAANQDVAQAGMNAREHYVRHGHAERRRRT
ncbi:phytanoyl-CoA dioxygenase family protein [Massilia sp. W12]|uniref:phytanoyl-CoA dioxygenase family protein n=1 Tax=Massilia sp. W12 TaxID=3126507 RepID=UPI0030D2D550